MRGQIHKPRNPYSPPPLSSRLKFLLWRLFHRRQTRVPESTTPVNAGKLPEEKANENDK